MDEYLLNRVATANGAQLVALLYEGLIESLGKAGEAMEAQDRPGLLHELDRGRNILTELLTTLEGDSELARQLRSMYLFVNRLMAEAAAGQKKQRLQEAIQVLTPLYEGWKELGDREALASSAHQGSGLVAGFTYGKGQLKEHVISQTEQWKKG